MNILIIIYIYNSQDYIIKLLKSIKNQTYKKYKVCLINDNSTDNSLKIINEFINKNNTNFILINNVVKLGKYITINKLNEQYVL